VRKQGQELSQYGTVQSDEGKRQMTREKLIHHIESLREKHEKLDKDIKELEAHHTDSMKVETLKKLKLKLKDEIEETSQKLKKLS
jgi:uncharacterized protein YdcH (DUF465 family)